MALSASSLTVTSRRHRSRAWHAGAIAVILTTPLSARVEAQPRPSFRADTWLVVLHAVAMARGGALVTNLEPRAVTVYEDGKAQPIKMFRREDVPVSLGLVIDNSGSMRALRATVVDAARAFVRASNSLDETFVINFADTPRLAVPLTADGRSIETGLAAIDSAGGTAVRDAIIAAEEYLHRHATHERKVLLLITDGNDNGSKASTSELRRTIDRATDTTLFAVGLGRDAPGNMASRGDELADVAERTGGSMHWARSKDDVRAVVLDVARAIRQQYTIAYAPLNQALDGTYRTVRVKATTSERVRLRTRTGYWATSDSVR
jgi:Ca-activated chloride channel homolog